MRHLTIRLAGAALVFALNGTADAVPAFCPGSEPDEAMICQDPDLSRLSDLAGPVPETRVCGSDAACIKKALVAALDAKAGVRKGQKRPQTPADGATIYRDLGDEVQASPGDVPQAHRRNGFVCHDSSCYYLDPPWVLPPDCRVTRRAKLKCR
jgi:hypothetical protein